MKILIINSKGHWTNGWAVTQESLAVIVDIIQRTGLAVSVIEVSSLQGLQKVLGKTGSDTLVWPNAYLVDTEPQKTSDLVSWIEKYQLPFIGSGYTTLQQLLHKNICQAKLKEADIPVPPHRIIEANEIKNTDFFILNDELSFPAIIKPSKQSRSNGVQLVNNREEAIQSIKTIFSRYPDNNVLIEAFLPGDDVTCGYFKLGDKKMLLPTYCAIEGLDCKKGVYSEYHYTLPHTIESHPRVENTSVLNQLEEYMPRIVDLFSIYSNTRVDARLDSNGKLNFFDVNGMPGLNFPSSAVIKQAVTHFPRYGESFLFECLIYTIIGESLSRYNMPLPFIIKERNLFNLESQTIINIH